jgi:hypothetical protein
LAWRVVGTLSLISKALSIVLGAFAGSGMQANSAGSDQEDHEYAALKRRSILTVSENVTWVRMDLILAVASLTE